MDGGSEFENKIRPRPLPQQVDHWLRPGDVAADCPPKCLAQGSCQNVDIDTEVIRRACAVRPHKAGGVAIIDHDDGVVCVGQLADFRQVGQITVHREHAVGCDHDVPRPVFTRLFQPGFEVVHVVVHDSDSAWPCTAAHRR